ncbi:MAG: FGGY family carbohydrate kinase [Ilumatobacteraceae bacterium]
MSDCVLAIDLGTGGPKVALVEATGHTLAWRSRPVATHFVDSAEGRGAEQDPEEMWAAIVAAAREVLAAVQPVPPIVAVAVTSQYMSTIPVAADGRPTGPCILWMDTRGAAHNLTLLTDESFMLFLDRHGMIPLPSGNDNVAHAHVLQTHHPEAYAAAVALVEPMDYVVARLSGRVCATQSTVFGQLVCDNRQWGATSYDPDLVAATGLDPAKLAPLVPLHGQVGEVLAGPAAELGIPTGTPVDAGHHRLHHVGGRRRCAGPDGGVGHHWHHVGDGQPHSRPPRRLIAGILSVPSPVDGMYYVMAENGVGGRSLEFAQRLFGVASAGRGRGAGGRGPPAATVAWGSCRGCSAPSHPARTTTCAPRTWACRCTTTGRTCCGRRWRVWR